LIFSTAIRHVVPDTGRLLQARTTGQEGVPRCRYSIKTEQLNDRIRDYFIRSNVTRIVRLLLDEVSARLSGCCQL
jgi:hypothetical protein